MKIFKSILLFVLLSFALLSCDNGNKDEAEKKVAEFTRYVDSISEVTNDNLNQNWDSVEKIYTDKKLQAQSALEVLSSNPDLRKNLNEANSRFKKFKNRFTLESQKKASTERKMKFRKSFFEQDDIGSNLTFDLVYKDNLVSIYENFVNKIIENQDSYVTEEWIELKLIHDSLVARKNTIEEVEGFSTIENFKISKLKLKFIEIYTLKTTHHL